MHVSWDGEVKIFWRATYDLEYKIKTKDKWVVK
jgi:hypothetical protein